MMQKLSTLLVVVLAGGALAAGCGSSSSTTTTTQASSNQTFPKPPPLSPAAVARAQATCKQKVQGEASLSPSEKAKLEQLCGKAQSTDPEAIRKATEEACVALLNASHVPAGVARERALALCHVAG
jgi:hypothetical protein